MQERVIITRETTSKPSLFEHWALLNASYAGFRSNVVRIRATSGLRFWLLFPQKVTPSGGHYKKDINKIF